METAHLRRFSAVGGIAYFDYSFGMFSPVSAQREVLMVTLAVLPTTLPIITRAAMTARLIKIRDVLIEKIDFQTPVKIKRS
jgi:hypothetical protein